jgi:hypothetical protein
MDVNWNSNLNIRLYDCCNGFFSCLPLEPPKLEPVLYLVRRFDSDLLTESYHARHAVLLLQKDPATRRVFLSGNSERNLLPLLGRLVGKLRRVALSLLRGRRGDGLLFVGSRNRNVSHDNSFKKRL